MKSGYSIVQDIGSDGNFAWDVIDRETKERKGRFKSRREAREFQRQLRGLKATQPSSRQASLPSHSATARSSPFSK